MQHVLMDEYGLMQNMSGAKITPDDHGEEATARQKAAFERNKQEFGYENGEELARLYPAVPDSAKSDNSITAQVVRAHGST